MRISLDALLVVDSIARSGSFAAAAEELHRVPSAITYTVQKLEQDLDVTLFDRSRHRARLTPAGEELLREGRYLIRAAADLEARVRRVASGWESELCIALDEIVPFARIIPLLQSFYAENSGTRLRLFNEVLGGSWEALTSGRVDLAIGATGDPPPGNEIEVRLLGQVRFEFVVAPRHALAQTEEPLSDDDIARHRMVPLADTSRTLPPRSIIGLIDARDMLTVPTAAMKTAAHIAGLGVGFIPERVARREVTAGRLIIKRIDRPRAPVAVSYAWRGRADGNALRWFLARLDDPALRETLLS
jgi:DNA-binding transcriptional LysR family regulator